MCFSYLPRGGTPCPGRADLLISLRRHYPDQVQTVGGPSPPSQPICGRAPVALKILPLHGGDRNPRSSSASSTALGAGDLDAALALTTEDVVLDRSNSKAPWRGDRQRSRGGPRRQRRVPRPDRRDRLEGRRDAAGRVPSWSRSETEISVAGTIERDQRARPRRLAGSLRGRADRRGRAVPELRRGAARRRAGGHWRRRASTSSARPSPHGRATRGRCSRPRSRGGVDVIQLREKAPRCAEELIAFAEPFARRRSRARRALLPQRLPRAWSRPAAPTASTSARTTSRSPRPAPRPPAPRRWSGSRPTPRTQFDAALAAGGEARPDQISAGPVWETPTKAGAARRRAGADRARGSGGRRRRSRGSRSAASTPATSPRWSPRARGGSSSCGRSATPPTPRPPRASCARRSTAEPGV